MSVANTMIIVMMALLSIRSALKAQDAENAKVRQLWQTTTVFNIVFLAIAVYFLIVEAK